MTTRNLILGHQTTLAVHIIIEDETGVLAFSILLVTRLFTCFWHLSQLLVTAGYELSLLVNDLKAALSFTTKVFAIAFNSLAYGVGVKL